MGANTNSGTPQPSVWAPGVRSCYGNGWRQLWKYFLELFLILIIGIIISLPFTLFQN